jgi:hypothetical protein
MKPRATAPKHFDPSAQRALSLISDRQENTTSDSPGTQNKADDFVMLLRIKPTVPTSHPERGIHEIVRTTRAKKTTSRVGATSACHGTSPVPPRAVRDFTPSIGSDSAHRVYHRIAAHRTKDAITSRSRPSLGTQIDAEDFAMPPRTKHTVPTSHRERGIHEIVRTTRAIKPPVALALPARVTEPAPVPRLRAAPARPAISRPPSGANFR